MRETIPGFTKLKRFQKMVAGLYHIWMIPETDKIETPAHIAALPYTQRSRIFWAVIGVVMAIPIALLYMLASNFDQVWNWFGSLS